MGYTKETAIKTVVNCAEKFHMHLEGRSLLMVLSDKHKNISCIEFYFYGYNFLHLTGLKVKRKSVSSSENNPNNDIISANDFYKRCLEHKLSASDFEFAEDGTSFLKLDILPYLISKNLSAKMVGDFEAMKPRLYTEKLAGGTKGCIGFVIDGNSRQFVPNTVLKEDIRDNSKNTKRVIAVLRKTKDDLKYEEITYLVNKFDWTEIEYPEEYGYLKTVLKKPG